MLNPILMAHGMVPMSSVANTETAVTAAYTLKNNEGIVTNTSGGPFVVKLPPDPVNGTQVFLYDGNDWSTNNLTIDPQSKRIESLPVSETVVIDRAGGGLQLVFDGAKWKLFVLGLAVSGGSGSSGSGSPFSSHLLPSANGTYDLGSASYRWRNIYTQDLHLSNGIGDYTVVEGKEELYLVNNLSGKHFKFALIEVDPSEVPPKAKVAHGD